MFKNKTQCKDANKILRSEISPCLEPWLRLSPLLSSDWMYAMMSWQLWTTILVAIYCSHPSHLFSRSLISKLSSPHISHSGVKISQRIRCRDRIHIRKLRAMRMSGLALWFVRQPTNGRSLVFSRLWTPFLEFHFEHSLRSFTIRFPRISRMDRSLEKYRGFHAAYGDN